MSVTAMRVGSSPLSIDWTGLAQVPPRPDPDVEALQTAWTALQTRFQSGEVGFFDAPHNDELSQAVASQALATKLLATGTFTDCLFLGIGGSALGPIALLEALKHRRQNTLRFHFLENPDPFDWTLTSQHLKPATTLICVVTKSGGTFETLAQLMVALQWLGSGRWKSQVIVITDPTKGELRAFAQSQGLMTLSIAPSMGGRFSAFTPVGLFPLFLAGLGGEDFLKGAAQVRDSVQKTAPEKNGLFLLAEHLIRHFQKRPIHVCMPYSSRLRLTGDWWVQLWGESLGKDGKGFTPLAAVGAIDQHSLLQLLRDGPDDKITWFVTIEKIPDPVILPRVELKAMETPPTFTLLQGQSLQSLLEMEYRATSLVLTRRTRPHLTLRIEQLDERSLGALFFGFAVLTAFTGTLWGVNPFDQPGVEEGKVYLKDSLAESRAARSAETDSDDNSPVSRLRRQTH